MRALRSENEDLSRKVDALTGRVETLSARAGRAPSAADSSPARPAAPVATVVPPDLAVVRMEPEEDPPSAPLRDVPVVREQPTPRPPRAAAPEAVVVRVASPVAAPRVPPPVPTSVPIAEPDPERLEGISRRGGREISVEADDELKRARKRGGVARAHALEDFVARYPRHPSADNALVEAAAAYADAGQPGAACRLARRATGDYPAGDAMSDALERLAWCEARSGSVAAERRLLERLVAEFPSTPAAERAGTRLATISGDGGDAPPAPARSGP